MTTKHGLPSGFVVLDDDLVVRKASITAVHGLGADPDTQQHTTRIVVGAQSFVVARHMLDVLRSIAEDEAQSDPMHV